MKKWFKNTKINLSKFSQIPLLSYKKIIFNVYNFNPCKMEMHRISLISHFQKLLIERTEQQMIMNIIFDKNALDLSNLRKYENIAWFFYNEGLFTKFINSKDFIISFPQLFNRYKHFNASEEDIEAIFSYNSNKEEDSELLNFLERNNAQAKMLRGNIFHIEDIKPDVELLKRKINPAKASRGFEIFEENGYEKYRVGQFKRVGVGGSFDHSHIGHNLLLTTAALLSSNMISVGVTSDMMIAEKDTQNILQPYKQREVRVRKLLSSIGYSKQIVCEKLNDIVGNAGSDKDMQALILTEESYSGGVVVNQSRVAKNLPPLRLVNARLVFYKGQYTLENKISSRKIREAIKHEAKPMDEFFNLWNNFASKVNISQEKAVVWFSTIRDLYSQFWRKFHTFARVKHILSVTQSLLENNKIEDVHSFLASAWFNDLIFVPLRKDNKKRCVLMLNEFCKDTQITLVDKERAGDNIMRTMYHLIDQEDLIDMDMDLKYFLDADLSVMGLKRNEYEIYKDQLRQEYFFFGDAYPKVRARYLNNLLKRRRLFYTDEFAHMYENSARENIKWEIQSLAKAID